MARIGHVPKAQLYSGPGYNLFDPPVERRQFEEETTFLNSAATTNAAEALRVAEVEAGKTKGIDPDDTELDSTCLHSMTIDELRIVAGLVAVPDREQITSRTELIAAIERAE